MTALFPDVVHTPGISCPVEFFTVAPGVVAARSIAEYVSVKLIVTDEIKVFTNALFAGTLPDIVGAVLSRTTVTVTAAL